MDKKYGEAYELEAKDFLSAVFRSVLRRYGVNK